MQTTMDKKTHTDDAQRSPKIQSMLGEKLPAIIRLGTIFISVLFAILAVIAVLMPISEDGTTIFDLLADK